jgi:hypothetical protein
MDGFRGDPYDSGPQKCRDQEQLYLEELFGMNKCYGCRYVCVCACGCVCNCDLTVSSVSSAEGWHELHGNRYEPALYGTYESVNITRVLDVGTGACGVVRRFINHGMDVQVSYP